MLLIKNYADFKLLFNISELYFTIQIYILIFIQYKFEIKIFLLKYHELFIICFQKISNYYIKSGFYIFVVEESSESS